MDIVVTGHMDAEHLKNLSKVLRKMEEDRLCLKQNKCCFIPQQVDYMGHVISCERIQPAVDKVWAIQEAPAPNGVHQLNFFSQFLYFIPNFYRILPPLQHLYTSFYRNTILGPGVWYKVLLSWPRLSSQRHLSWFTTVTRMSSSFLVMLFHTVLKQFCPIVGMMAQRSQLPMSLIHLPQQVPMPQ